MGRAEERWVAASAGRRGWGGPGVVLDSGAVRWVGALDAEVGSGGVAGVRQRWWSFGKGDVVR